MSFSVGSMIAAAVGGAGGATAVMLGLAKWAGKLLQQGLIEARKAEYARQLEEVKQQHAQEIAVLASTLEEQRGDTARLKSAVFTTCKSIMEKLGEVDRIANRLWEKVDGAALVAFREALVEAETATATGSLFLGKSRTEEIEGVLSIYYDYQKGKSKLRNLYESDEDSELVRDLINGEIRELVAENGELRQKYTSCLDSIREDFRSLIGIEFEQ